MNKRIAILTLTLMLAMGAQAQIFLDDQASNRSDYQAEEVGVMPYHQVEHDQANYIPIGNGIALLAALGGAYLYRKKKRKTLDK